MLNDDFEFPPECWDGFSDDAKDFIARLMEKYPVRRMSAAEALAHAWLAYSDRSEQTTDPADSTEAMQSRDGDDSDIRSCDPTAEGFRTGRERG